MSGIVSLLSSMSEAGHVDIESRQFGDWNDSETGSTLVRYSPSLWLCIYGRCFCSGSAFSVRKGFAGLLIGIVTELDHAAHG